MGDVSAEPSMEDILSSIKRIIAEDGEAGQPGGRVRRPARPVSSEAAPAQGEPQIQPQSQTLSESLSQSLPQSLAQSLPQTMPQRGDDAEILELSNPAPMIVPTGDEPAPEVTGVRSGPGAGASSPAPASARTPGQPPVRTGESIVSRDALASSRGSLDALTRAVAGPEVAEPTTVGGVKSMDAFVADLLRPMLREWLDANLPELDEAMVAKEIARITGSR